MDLDQKAINGVKVLAGELILATALRGFS